MSRIEAVFDDGPAFVPYLVVGDPDVESSRAYVEALERGGADLIELGLPFSEPIAEGPTIQHAIDRALKGGMTPERFFEFVEDLDVELPLICMTYYNLVYQYGRRETNEPGPEAFVRRAAAAGLDGLIVPDLPAEESEPLRDACDAADIDLIFIVAPTTGEERLERIMSQVSGFVYVQARLGTTGARAALSRQTEASLARLEGYDVPKAVGFGISDGDQARAVVAAGADGVIVGSALVDIVAEDIEAGTEVATVAARLEEKARELKSGAIAGLERAESEGT